MRILIVSDAWTPQVNGVVRTLLTLKDKLEQRGHDVHTITPNDFRTIPCPTYPEIPLALMPGSKVAHMIEAARPCVIHIATEGPLGLAARRYCVKRDIPFTTAFHTKFPEYIQARTRLPLSVGYKAVRWFHGPSRCVMVATQGIEDELKHWGVTNVARWGRGVDTDLFKPSADARTLFGGDDRPVFLYVGRVAVEKNIGAFLDLDLPGRKVVVGGGPQMDELKRKYPGVTFTGPKFGEDLARHYAAADVFVFPSLTDTFGLVVLEALACGTPVAAYPVAGPRDVIGDAPVGVLHDDLRAAALAALDIPRDRCRAFGLANNWDKSVDQFLDNLAPFDTDTHFPSLSQEREPAPQGKAAAE
ncbi:glycosyltransferase family 4 protein [Caenispirillum salinarum]|uniref:glycosyltransferase family 4 protein n=1 Tax=Caenispirillum salinarum TaxID=859058 RepID=UPI00068ACCE5|nr:glycosyltransferase family 1 protein [Caenispirillum salinarum]